VGDNLVRLLHVIFVIVLVTAFACDKNRDRSTNSSNTSSTTAAANSDVAGSVSGSGAGFGNAAISTNNGITRQYVCDLTGMTIGIGHQSITWEIKLSPNKLHVGVIRYRQTTDGVRYHGEVDGVPGPEAEWVGDPLWSADCSSHAYTITDAKQQYIIHQGKTFGPYSGVGQIALQDATNHWAAFVGPARPKGTAVSDVPCVLVIDDKVQPIIPAMDSCQIHSLRFDAVSQSVIFQDRSGNWISNTGQQVSPPVIPPPRGPVPFPANTVCQTTTLSLIKKYGIVGYDDGLNYRRVRLIVNNNLVGDFDCVWGHPVHGTFQPGFAQPDQSICIWAADNEKLYRLLVPPPAKSLHNN
jgi:hypothetical protein